MQPRAHIPCRQCSEDTLLVQERPARRGDGNAVEPGDVRMSHVCGVTPGQDPGVAKQCRGRPGPVT